MRHAEKHTFKTHASSHIGGRANNEDAYLVNEEMGLFIVADGMGGHEKGEIASWFTSKNLNRIVTAFKEQSLQEDTSDGIELSISSTDSDDGLLTYAIMKINHRLYRDNENAISELTEGKTDAEKEAISFLAKKKRMGTTLISLFFRGRHAWVTHIGDSRCYRISKDKIELLTRDHTWIEEQTRSGEITPEEAKTHKKRNIITRSVGYNENVEVDVERLIIYPPERFLLCSDGLSNVVDEKDILSFGQIRDVRAACNKMVEEAVNNGGKDNITAVLIDVSKQAKPEDVPQFSNLREFTDEPL